nr:MAG TPA: hypothetical protein [Caudoviricetes sp.]
MTLQCSKPYLFISLSTNVFIISIIPFLYCNYIIPHGNENVNPFLKFSRRFC